MWFTRKHHEYGCPMCGRLPKIIQSIIARRRDFLTIYRLQCPRKHISTDWFGYPGDASRQWRQLVDEYKGKDTK